jgi:hypothetical protein
LYISLMCLIASRGFTGCREPDGVPPRLRISPGRETFRVMAMLPQDSHVGTTELAEVLNSTEVTCPQPSHR